MAKGVQKQLHMMPRGVIQMLIMPCFLTKQAASHKVISSPTSKEVDSGYLGGHNLLLEPIHPNLLLASPSVDSALTLHANDLIDKTCTS